MHLINNVTYTLWELSWNIITHYVSQRFAVYQFSLFFIFSFLITLPNLCFCFISFAFLTPSSLVRYSLHFFAALLLSPTSITVWPWGRWPTLQQSVPHPAEVVCQTSVPIFAQNKPEAGWIWIYSLYTFYSPSWRKSHLSTLQANDMMTLKITQHQRR